MSEPTLERVGLVYDGGTLTPAHAALLVEASQLAIAAINATGGVLGRLLTASIFDPKAVTASPSTAPHRDWLQDERPVVLVGDPAAVKQPAVQALLEAEERLFWSPLPVLAGSLSPYCLHTGPCPNQWVEPALTWLRQQGYLRLYYLATDTPLGRALGRLLQAQVPPDAWGGITYVPPDCQDFTAALAAALAAGPQALVCAIAQHTTAFYHQSRQMGLDPQALPTLNLLSELTPSQDPEAAGHYQLVHSYLSVNPDHAAFRERFGAYVDSTIEAAYTQIHLWAQAVELAGTFTGDRVRAAAYGLHGRAPSGLVQLEANQCLSRQAYILRQQGEAAPELVWRSRSPLKPLPWLGCLDQAPVVDVAIAHQATQAAQVQVHALEQRLWALETQFSDRTSALAAANDQLVGEIVERQQAEDALRAIKEQLEAILSAVPGIVSWISADHKYLGVNQELADLFGLDPENFVNQDIGFLGTSTEFIDFITQLFTGDRDEAACEIANLIDGELRTFLLVAQKYDNGAAAFIIGIDISARQQAIQELARSKDQLQAVLDAVPGIVSWISADLRYLGVNRQLAATFNLQPEDFVNQDLGFLQASQDFNEFVHELFASPTSDSFREVETLVDGEIRNYLIAAQKYDEGRAAFTVGIDITQRHQALKKLARSTEQLQAILDAVPGIVSWISADLRYLGVNRHLAATFNLEPEAFEGQDIGFLQASEEFYDFVRDFFASEVMDDFREVEAVVQGEPRNYLIASQKYDGGQAAFVVGIDITARQRALQALRQAETKYRTIFENAVEGIFQTSPDGRYLSANPALARIYGYASPEDLMANLTNIAEQLYVEPSQRTEFLNQLVETGSVVGFESQIYRRDGTVVWISENARAVRDEAGNLLYLEGTVEAINERKQAEAALKRLNENLEERVQQRTSELQQLNLQLLMEIGERERAEAALRNSEAELKALFAAMTDVIAVFDYEGRYIKLVATNSEMLYSPKQERLGRTVREVLPPEVAALFLEKIHAAITRQRTVNAEYSLPVGDGAGTQSDRAWFSASISPLPEQRVIWVARNITERRRVLSALEAAEEKYRSIFENAAEGIFQTSPEGQFLSANPALVRMYGYDSFADLSTHVTNIDRQLYLEPELRAQLRQRLAEAGAVSNFQARVWRKDGRAIWTAENVREVRDANGQLLYYEGTVADITQRKQAEDALRAERETSERLLLNVLPRTIAERLKHQEQAIAERFDEVSILFADIVDFTTLSAQVPPTELVGMLNEIFSSFDHLVEQYGLEKIKTIGDAYMVAGGLPEPKADHAEAIAELALDMQREIAQFRRHDGECFRLRIGINIGPVVAGVIGLRKFIYDLWGDTVNVASRMEAQGSRGAIQTTTAMYLRLRDRYQFEERGEITVKGKGTMHTYWLRGRQQP